MSQAIGTLLCERPLEKLCGHGQVQARPKNYGPMLGQLLEIAACARGLDMNLAGVRHRAPLDSSKIYHNPDRSAERCSRDYATAACHKCPFEPTSRRSRCAEFRLCLPASHFLSHTLF